MKISFFLLLSFLFLNTTSNEELLFWGQNGHRATAKIAETHLSKKAKKNINKLLNGKSLAFISTYADEIKSDRKYRSFSPWHYVNMGLEEDYKSSKKNPKGDLVTGITTCIAVLKNPQSTDENKEFHLKMLVHLIGDLHQPLHIGRKDDKGGNTIQVQWFGKGTNLHTVWDTKMIEQWNMSYIELAANADKLSKKQLETIQKGSVVDWVNEVHQITKQVYNSAKNGDKLKYRYSYDYFGIVRTQIQKGGIRLAWILNNIYK